MLIATRNAKLCYSTNTYYGNHFKDYAIPLANKPYPQVILARLKASGESMQVSHTPSHKDFSLISLLTHAHM